MTHDARRVRTNVEQGRKRAMRARLAAFHRAIANTPWWVDWLDYAVPAVVVGAAAMLVITIVQTSGA